MGRDRDTVQVLVDLRTIKTKVAVLACKPGKEVLLISHMWF